MIRSSYDLSVLREQAALWRAEAASATVESMRAFCLAEADQCERRVQASMLTPVIREAPGATFPRSQPVIARRDSAGAIAGSGATGGDCFAALAMTGETGARTGEAGAQCRPGGPVIARRDSAVAIPRIGAPIAGDCFAALAMTGEVRPQ